MLKLPSASTRLGTKSFGSWTSRVYLGCLFEIASPRTMWQWRREYNGTLQIFQFSMITQVSLLILKNLLDSSLNRNVYFVIIVTSDPTRTSVTDFAATRNWRLRNTNALTYRDIHFRTRWRIFRVNCYQQSQRKASEVPGIRSLWLARDKSARIRVWSCRMLLNSEETKLFRASISGCIAYTMTGNVSVLFMHWSKLWQR